MLADWRTAPVPPKTKAMLQYLELVASGSPTLEDARALKAAGVSRAEAEDALFVAMCFGQIVRIADALGWEVGDKASFDASATSLLKFGYLLPGHSKAPKRTSG